MRFLGKSKDKIREEHLQDITNKYSKEIGIPAYVKVFLGNKKYLNKSFIKKSRFLIKGYFQKQSKDIYIPDLYIPSIFHKDHPFMCVSGEEYDNFKSHENILIYHELGHLKDNLYSEQPNAIIRNDKNHVDISREQGFNTFFLGKLFEDGLLEKFKEHPEIVFTYQENIQDCLVGRHINSSKLLKPIIKEENKRFSIKDAKKMKEDLEKFWEFREIAFPSYALELGLFITERPENENDYYKSFCMLSNECGNIVTSSRRFFSQIERPTTITMLCDQIEEIENFAGLLRINKQLNDME